MATIGDLVVNLTANSQQFTRGLKNAANAVTNFATRATKQVATVGAAFSGLAIAKGVSEAANLENLTVQFEVLLGSLDQANSLMAQIRSYGAQTPFQTNDIATGAKQLLNAGVAAQDIIPTLKILGDLAAAGGKNLTDVAFVFSQVRSAGRLMGQDLNQLLNANIPVIAALAEEFGVAEGEVRDLVSTGAVTYDRLFSAMQKLTGEGGRLNGMTEKLSQTTTGLWSTVKDNISQAAAELGTFIVQQFKVREAMQQFSKFMTGTFLPAFKAIAVNWQALWDLMVSGAALQLVRIMEGVKHLGEQVAAVAKFIWQSMVSAFETVGDAAGTIFANIKAGNFDNPMEGFQNQLGNTVLELPDRVESELEKELSRQFDAAASKFGEGFAREFEAALPDVGAAIPNMFDATADKSRIGKSEAKEAAETKKSEEVKFAGSAERGSQEAFSTIVQNVFGGRNNAQQQQLEEQKKANKLLAEQNQILKQKASAGKGMVVSEFK